MKFVQMNAYYGEVPELQGVWASGKTLEECRKNLEEVMVENLNIETTGEIVVT